MLLHDAQTLQNLAKRVDDARARLAVVSATAELEAAATEYVLAHRALDTAIATGDVTATDPPPTPPAPPVDPLPLLGVNGSGAWAERMGQCLTAVPGLQLVRTDYANNTRWKAGWAAEAIPLIRRARARMVLVVPDNQTMTSAFTSFCKTWLQAGDVIEYGNESSYIDASLTLAAGKAYAGRLAAFITAFRAAGFSHGVLCQADPAMRGTGWITGMYQAVANLHERVLGFTVHPYGPMEPTTKNTTTGQKGRDGAKARIATMVQQLHSKGAPADVQVWITEDGASSDNGVKLDDNYDLPLAMTHDQAGVFLVEKIRALAALPANVAAWIGFQDVDQGVAAPLPGATNGRELHFGWIERATGRPKTDLVKHLNALIATVVAAGEG